METEKVIRAILANPGSSAADLAALTSVNPRTINTVLQRYDTALIKTAGESDGQVGRPPDRVSVKPEWIDTLVRRVGRDRIEIDPIVSGLELIEEAAKAIQTTRSQADAERIRELASIQIETVSNLLVGQGRNQDQLRLALAVQKLKDQRVAESEESHVAATAIAVPVVESKIKPPRADWDRWNEELRDMATKFFGEFIGIAATPGLAIKVPSPITLIIDAIPGNDDPVSRRLVDAFSSKGLPAIHFSVREEWSAKMRNDFFKDLQRLADDPISCLSPMFVTLNSKNTVSMALWKRLEQLNDVSRRTRIIRKARLALKQTMAERGVSNGEIAQRALFYGSLMESMKVDSEHAVGPWAVVPGPAVMDEASTETLRSRTAELHCDYVGFAGSADIEPVLHQRAETSSTSQVSGMFGALVATN